jgi:hypothetical protein
LIKLKLLLAGNDPKFNTSVQRAWDYIKDPGIKAIDQLGINNVEKIYQPEKDNFLSLPLGGKIFL